MQDTQLELPFDKLTSSQLFNDDCWDIRESFENQWKYLYQEDKDHMINKYWTYMITNIVESAIFYQNVILSKVIAPYYTSRYDELNMSIMDSLNKLKVCLHVHGRHLMINRLEVLFNEQK